MDPIDSRLAARATADAANEVAKLAGMDVPIVMMSCEHARALIEHRAHLITRVDELQTRMSAMVIERQQRIALATAAMKLAREVRLFVDDPNTGVEAGVTRELVDALCFYEGTADGTVKP